MKMARSITRAGLALAGLLPLPAQTTSASQAPPLPTLREVGRATGLGGEIRQCAFDGNGSRMLTVGHLGDLAWWDLASLTVLAHRAPIERYVTALALHPTEPWGVLACTAGGAGGALFRVALPTGDVQRLAAGSPQGLAFDARGRWLAVISALGKKTTVEVFATDGLAPDSKPAASVVLDSGWRGHPVFARDGASLYLSDQGRDNAGGRHVRVFFPGGQSTPGPGAIVAFGDDGRAIVAQGGRETFAVADDGGAAALCEGEYLASRVTRLWPDRATWDCAPRTDSWLASPWVAPNGTVVVPDVQGQIHVLGPAPDQHRLVAAHGASITGLAWSPDSQYLALQSSAALRIVDATGTVVRDLPGAHAVVPGPQGGEFALATWSGVRRWDAASDRDLRTEVAWRGGRPELLISNPTELDWRAPLHAIAPMVGWLGGMLFGEGRRPCAPGPVRATEHGLVAEVPHTKIAGIGRPMHVVLALRDDQRDRVLLAEAAVPMSCGTGLYGPVFGTVRAFGSDGREVAHAAFTRGVRWLVPGEETLLMGLDDGAVCQLDAGSLVEANRWTLDSPLLWLHVLDPRRAVAGDGKRVLIVALPEGDSEPRVTAALTLPPDLGPVTRAALAPDRRHLALASGADVRIVVVE